MRKFSVWLVAAVAFIGGLFAAMTAISLQGQTQPAAGFAAVPGERGGSDLFGPYEPVADWPKPLSQLPGHDQWTWGATEAVFAETANRVFAIHLGELPKLQRPAVRALPDIGPSLSFPVGEVPFRHASQGQFASPPGGGGPGADPDDPAQQYKGRVGIDSRWEHLVLVYNAAGDIVEQWTQWDKMLRRPHGIHISPYDPEKHVWIVDDHNDVLYKFTHDGKQLVQTIGTKGVRGQDSTHFDRPTFMAFLPDGSMFVSDGYNGHSVVKLDKNGKFVTSWGMAGTPGGKETRPNYFNVVHGIAADPVTKRIYVSDRGNRRLQVFDENGKYLDQWPIGQQSQAQFLIAQGDGGVWTFEDPARISKYDKDGHLLYSWGSLGDYPGGFLNMHSASVDPDGNLYTAEVGNARVQKFRPRAGARPEFLVGKPPGARGWR
jgi:DNA-binding beta-propeller fold protein YncE